MRRVVPSLLLALVLSACSTIAPQSRPTPPPATRRPAAPTATPSAAASALGIVPIKIEESPLPPAEPTPPGFAAGRATPTPFATPEAAWKYVTITFAVENRSDAPWLAGIAGGEPSTTNLSDAVLTTRDGTRYKPVHSTTSFGLRTATSHALVNYPVLARIPPGFRVAAESAGSLSVIAPPPNAVTFKVPASLSDYGVLSVPPLAVLGSKSGDDDVSREMRPLIGGFAPFDLGSAAAAAPTFPTLSPPNVGVGGTAPLAGGSTVTLVSVEAGEPDDFQLRNAGWKQVTVALQYHNNDAQPRAFNLAGWLFGDDGVAYTGDAPTVGDFGRLLTPPDPSAIPLWDGRSAGVDQTPAGQALEPRRATFVVPKTLQHAVLVLAGDGDVAFDVTGIPAP